MNLKEAFRVQNIYRNYIKNMQYVLNNSDNQYKITQTTFFSKVEPTQEDEVLASDNTNVYQEHMDEAIKFLMEIFTQRSLLTNAISIAKRKIGIDIDVDLMMNKERRELASLLSNMSNAKESKQLLKNSGTGYRFNINNEQIPFRCDIERVATPRYNPEIAKDYSRNLLLSAERVSNEIDRVILDTEVDYVSPFDLLDSLENNFLKFVEKNSEQN